MELGETRESAQHLNFPSVVTVSGQCAQICLGLARHVDVHHVDSTPLASPLFSRQQPVEDSDSDGGGDENNTGLADSDEFQELVRFLATVPLLHAQLDAADMPKSRMPCGAWSLAFDQAGEESQAFFMVEQGKASSVAAGEGNEISSKATLLQGDYVGAKALSVRKKAFATVKTEGKLVVLRMLRDDFEELGLPK